MAEPGYKPRHSGSAAMLITHNTVLLSQSEMPLESLYINPLTVVDEETGTQRVETACPRSYSQLVLEFEPRPGSSGSQLRALITPPCSHALFYFVLSYLI